MGHEEDPHPPGDVRAEDVPAEIQGTRRRAGGHLGAIAITAGAVVALVAGAVILGVRRARQRRRPLERARRLRDAVLRLIARSELIASPGPSLGRRAAVTAGSLAVQQLVQAAARKLLH